MNDAIKKETTPMDMIAIAIEKGADLPQLERLLDLKERWEAGEAKKAFVQAMNNFKSDPPKLMKNKHVKFKKKDGGFTEYWHASLDHICEEVGKSLAKHGLSYRWSTEQLDNGAVNVTCILTHELGHSESSFLKSGLDQSGGKNNIQALGSSVSYLQRYTLLSVTGLATEDDDGNSAGNPPVGPVLSQNQIKTINDKLKEYEIYDKQFYSWIKTTFKVKSIEEVSSANYERIIKAIESKK